MAKQRKRGRPQAEEDQLAADEKPAGPSLDEFVEAMHGQADTPQGGMPTIAWLQEHFQTKSAIIRYLINQGYTVVQIHKHTGIRYQMVRNVATNPLKRGPNEDWRTPHPKSNQSESETD